MEEYQVLARKYRPHQFKEVVGQDAIVQTLKNALTKQRVAHAYLFSGPKGSGKTTLARLFASALNCQFLGDDGEPCTRCTSCKEIASGFSLDVLEIDGASHRGIEDIRKINETVGFAPAGNYKIFLIDEVHMLTKEAFNALLKTLEEPPKHVKFFFATTEHHKIPSTIISRCQRFQLAPIAPSKIQEKLTQIAEDLTISFEPDALALISSISEGSLRDAESLFDQILSFCSGKITSQTVRESLGLSSEDLFFKLDVAGAQKNLVMAFTIAQEVFLSGKNIGYFVEELLSHFRSLFLIRNGQTLSSPLEAAYRQSAALYRDDQLLMILELLMEAPQILKTAICEKTALEMLLLRILRTHQRISLESLVDRLLDLEKKLNTNIVTNEPSQQEIPIKNIELPIKINPALSLTCQETVPLTNLDSTLQEKISPKKDAQPLSLSIQEKSRLDTLIRFAAKELDGSFSPPKTQ